MPSDIKDTNPKDALSETRLPISYIPIEPLLELGVAMYEGGIKYGPYNWRDGGVQYSVYRNAANRHMMFHSAGEDLDPDTGLSHLTKMMANIVILRDAQIQGSLIDDRPKTNIDLRQDFILPLEAQLNAIRTSHGR